MSERASLLPGGPGEGGALGVRSRPCKQTDQRQTKEKGFHMRWR